MGAVSADPDIRAKPAPFVGGRAETLRVINTDERTHANDLLGFEGHLVFPTSAFDQAIDAADAHVRLGGVRVHNRGMATFCGVYRRIIGTAHVPLGKGTEIALKILGEARDAGFRAVPIDTIAPFAGFRTCRR